MMTREMRLRCIILDKYPSLREFAKKADIPYSTLMTVLKRGVGGAGFDTVMRICEALGIEPEEIFADE